MNAYCDRFVHTRTKTINVYLVCNIENSERTKKTQKEPHTIDITKPK